LTADDDEDDEDDDEDDDEGAKSSEYENDKPEEAGGGGGEAPLLKARIPNNKGECDNDEARRKRARAAMVVDGNMSVCRRMKKGKKGQRYFPQAARDS